MAVTYPGERTSRGLGPSSIYGLAPDTNRAAFLPILTVFASGLANLLVFRPATASVMRQRRRQETIDGKKSYDPPPHSKEMLRLNKSFGRLHGISSLINLAGFAATLYYGAVLANRLS